MCLCPVETKDEKQEDGDDDDDNEEYRSHELRGSDGQQWAQQLRGQPLYFHTSSSWRWADGVSKHKRQM